MKLQFELFLVIFFQFFSIRFVTKMNSQLVIGIKCALVIILKHYQFQLSLKTYDTFHRNSSIDTLTI